MNVGHLLSRASRRIPGRPAVIWGDRVLSYAEVNERSNRLVHALQGLGLRAGDKVAVLSSNRPELVEVMFACFKAGFVLVPMNFRLHPDEHTYILNHSEASTLVFSEQFQEFAADAPRTVSSLRQCVGLGLRGDPYEGLLTGASSTEGLYEVAADSPAWLFYTSGTTGRPKGATLTHRNLSALVMNLLADVNPVEPGDVLLHVGPLSHASGLCVPHHVARGAAHVILERPGFDPAVVLAAINRYRVTTMFLVPTMIVALLECPELSRGDRSSLHTIIYGGAPMPMEKLRQAIENLGPILVQIYGQGEAPHTLTVLPKEEHIDEATVPGPSRLASAGREGTNVEVRVLDDHDRVLPAGQVGEVVARGDIVMAGYWRDAAASAETLRGGWLHTGDLGFIDKDGYLFLTDRKKDLIISGGMNIYSREVEDAICRHPDVLEVAVVGVPDPYWGESVKAFVVVKPRTAVSAEAIIQTCAQYLASYKKPRHVEFLPELPKGATGKILKRALKDRS